MNIGQARDLTFHRRALRLRSDKTTRLRIIYTGDSCLTFRSNRSYEAAVNVNVTFIMTGTENYWCGTQVGLLRPGDTYLSNRYAFGFHGVGNFSELDVRTGQLTLTTAVPDKTDLAVIR